MRYVRAAIIPLALTSATAPALAQIDDTMVAPDGDATGKRDRIAIGDGETIPFDAHDTFSRGKNAIRRDRAKLWLFAPDEMPFGCGVPC
jgi:hypothetical protein